MATGPLLLDVRNVGRQTRDLDRWLLQDVSLQVHGGDRIAVLGPTGSGKTMLLRALSLLDPIDSGEVAWRGELVSSEGIPNYRRHVLYLGQRPCLFSDTVENVLRFPFSLHVHRAAEFRRDEITARVRSLGRGAEFLQQETAHLSGGEAQLVAMLRAIQLDPCVLLLDEPTASLDSAATELAEQLVDDWFSAEAAQRAFVWVTHDVDQAERVADRIVKLSDGRVAESRD
jgi:putative ABC transport system ATP-binding protein